MPENDITADLITASIATSVIGRKISYYSTLSSTTDVAKGLVKSKTEEGTVVIADEQSAGRGRLSRAWNSPKGSIAMSVILYPQLEQLPGLIMVMSLAVRRAIEQTTGIKADIKWPNDVLISGRKVCGILIENDIRGKDVRWSIVSPGININVDKAQLMKISDSATSLYIETGQQVSKLQVIVHLLESLDLYYMRLRNGEVIYHEWRDCMVTLGKEVQVSGGEYVESGVAESVDSDGCLLVRRYDGSIARIVAGDVTLRY